MDVLYLVRTGNRNEELRYSLRSLVNLPYDRLFIAGHVPAWVRNVYHIRSEQFYGRKYYNSYMNFRRALNDVRLSNDFILMNDDFFVMQPMLSVPMLHRGSLAIATNDQVTKYPESGYSHGMLRTQALLLEAGIEEPNCYSIHTPMVINRHSMNGVLDRYSEHEPERLHRRTLYGNLMGVGGEQIAEDPKIGSPTDIFPTGPYISTKDRSFTHYPIGAYIKQQFPEPGPHELVV